MDDPAGDRALTGGLTSAEAAPGGDAGGLVPEGLDGTLVLVRHGESTFIVEGRFQGQADTPLSQDGVAQARLVGSRLAHPAAPPALPVPPAAPLEIAHSPLSRTAATAGAIAAAMADPAALGAVVTVRPDPGFIEIGQGEWEGLHRSEIERRWADVLATWRRRPLEAWAPGGEQHASPRNTSSSDAREQPKPRREQRPSAPLPRRGQAFFYDYLIFLQLTTIF